jgi:hypothetical protein
MGATSDSGEGGELLAASRRFSSVLTAYAVNPRFGNSSPAASTVRAPFRVTLDVNVDVAQAQTEQQLDRWLRPGRRGIAGTRVSAPDLMRRFQRTVTDPFAEVLQEADSLLLTPQQKVMPMILTPDQIIILPQTTRFLYSSRDRVHIRIFAR